MADKLDRIGVLTGGGDCPGLNAAIMSQRRARVHRPAWMIHTARMMLQASHHDFMGGGLPRPCVVRRVEPTGSES